MNMIDPDITGAKRYFEERSSNDEDYKTAYFKCRQELGLDNNEDNTVSSPLLMWMIPLIIFSILLIILLSRV